MYLIPLLATLMSCVFSGALPLVARNLGHRGVAVFSILSLTIAFISSALIWIDLYIGGAPVWLDLFGPWFEVGTVTVSWIFYYDLLTAHMLFTVTSVSLAVHIYAVVYMRSDPHLSLFMSYLSLFTFFMLVYVCGDNLLVMLVGWEGKLMHCLSGSQIENEVLLFLNFVPSLMAPLLKTPTPIRGFHVSHRPALQRIGPHTKLFNEILTGFLLGDGWLEKRSGSVRLGISLIDKFKDVAAWYKSTLYSLGYLTDEFLSDPLIRSKRPEAKPYYQIRTFSFSSLLPFYDAWYVNDPLSNKRVKTIPSDIGMYLTPLCLAIWIMGDGSGMASGGFKIASHSFSKEDNLLLCNLLGKLYGLKATVYNEGSKGQSYIRIWKHSTPLLKTLVAPYLKESCLYKFRFVKQ